MDWNQAVAKLAGAVCKIETPTGHGTGYVFHQNNAGLVAIATALHVVEHAHTWRMPINISSPASDHFLKSSDRVILTGNSQKDAAAILFFPPAGDFAELGINLLPAGSRVAIGCEVGWLGYPGIYPNDLCFFSGNVSAHLNYRSSYLIDGVAINGVSGGPVFYLDQTDGIQIIGAISAYSANRATGEALPGLSVAQDVSHYHAVIAHITSIEDAKRAEQSTSGSE